MPNQRGQSLTRNYRLDAFISYNKREKTWVLSTQHSALGTQHFVYLPSLFLPGIFLPGGAGRKMPFSPVRSTPSPPACC